MMRKSIVAISTVVSSFFFFAHTAYAQFIATCPEGDLVFGTLCRLSKPTESGNLIGRLLTFVFIGAILIALAFLIWGGVKWLTSGGEKTAVEEARNHIVAAIVGLVIIFLSYFVLNILVYFFTGKGLFEIPLPNLPDT